LHQYDAAIGDLDIAISENATTVELLRRRAYLKAVAGRFDEAIANYNTLADKGPESEHGVLGRGVVLYLEGKWRAASDVFAAILEKDPRDGLSALWYAKSNMR